MRTFFYGDSKIASAGGEKVNMTNKSAIMQSAPSAAFKAQLKGSSLKRFVSKM